METVSLPTEFRARVAHVCARASVADPFNSLLQREKYSDPNADIDLEQLAVTNLMRINRKCDEGAFLVEAGDFAAVACWEPPACTGAPELVQVPDEVEKDGRMLYADFPRGIERGKPSTMKPGQG